MGFQVMDVRLNQRRILLDMLVARCRGAYAVDERRPWSADKIGRMGPRGGSGGQPAQIQNENRG